MKSMMHEMEERVRYMTLGGFDFEKKQGRLFFMIYVIVVDIMKIMGDRGDTVVKVLCYKSEGIWFDSRRFHWIFPLT
jgi:hypothetical protein